MGQLKKVKKGKGWYGESKRHSLASKGVRTGRKITGIRLKPVPRMTGKQAARFERKNPEDARLIRKASKIDRTLFSDPKYQKYGLLVSYVNPTEARESVRNLNREFQKSRTRKKRIRILRVTVLAANRAKASAQRKRLSPKERKELYEISSIYRKSANQMKQKLR